MLYSDEERKLRNIINKYKNTRFKHNGRDINGLDCLGFVIAVYKEYGIIIPSDDGKAVSNDWFKYNPGRLVKGLTELESISVSRQDLKTLDLIYLAISNNIITHVGIMLNNNEFAHFSPKSDLLVSQLKSHWLTRFRGGLRFTQHSK